MRVLSSFSKNKIRVAIIIAFACTSCAKKGEPIKVTIGFGGEGHQAIAAHVEQMRADSEQVGISSLVGNCTLPFFELEVKGPGVPPQRFPLIGHVDANAYDSLPGGEFIDVPHNIDVFVGLGDTVSFIVSGGFRVGCGPFGTVGNTYVIAGRTPPITIQSPIFLPIEVKASKDYFQIENAAGLSLENSTFVKVTLQAPSVCGASYDRVEILDVLSGFQFHSNAVNPPATSINIGPLPPGRHLRAQWECYSGSAVVGTQGTKAFVSPFMQSGFTVNF